MLVSIQLADKGPQIFLSHIISILHFMLNYIDLNTASLINGDILRVATKYIEGPQWKDALKILKLAVTRSSSLTTPSYNNNAYYHSSIISSIVQGGGYQDCISLASNSFADAEFAGSFKRELPGRTLDFNFDLSLMPVVGLKFIKEKLKTEEQFEQQNNIQGSANDQLSNSDGSMNALSNEDIQSVQSVRLEPFTSSLKRNQVLAQVRIRERLIGLLNRCGQRVGLPKSPSVIFSQNSDILDHKSSMASSMEDMSATNNDISGDSKHDDTPRGEFAFKEFDFLEYELESQEGESLDNFNWGVRRKSLSNLENEVEVVDKTVPNDGHSDSAQEDSLSVQQTFSLNTHIKVENSVGNSNSLTIKNKDDFSSDDEVESVSPFFDETNVTSESRDYVPIPNPNYKQDSSRPVSLISHGSSHSFGSDAELNSHSCVAQTLLHIPSHPIGSIAESSPQQQQQFVLSCDAYEQWNMNFHRFLNGSANTLSMSNQLLSSVLKSMFHKVSSLTRESCELLLQSPTVNTHYTAIVSRFQDLLESISTQVEFPFVYIDSKFLQSVPQLLEQHRFTILEMHTHCETFNEKKDSLFACIVSMRNDDKQGASGGQYPVFKLCNNLYKVFFQLFLLFEGYLKFVTLLKLIKSQAEVCNFCSFRKVVHFS